MLAAPVSVRYQVSTIPIADGQEAAEQSETSQWTTRCRPYERLEVRFPVGIPSRFQGRAPLLATEGS